jgi:hydrogenase maturation protease
MNGGWLVVGVGNRDRGDDAVGPHVCDRLRALDGGPEFRSSVCEGSVVDLLLHWDDDDRVVIVDAIAPGDEPGRIVALDITHDVTQDATQVMAQAPSAVSTHEVDVSVAIELARALGRMPAQLLLIGVEAEQLAWGAPLSARVAAAADEVVGLLVELIGDGDRAHRLWRPAPSDGIMKAW